MKHFANLVEALDDLRKRGFTADFDLKTDRLKCAATQLELHPEDFEIVEVYRFEGVTNPSDSAILYAIEGKDGLNGVLVNAYGVYSDPVSAALSAKLAIHPHTT